MLCCLFEVWDSFGYRLDAKVSLDDMVVGVPSLPFWGYMPLANLGWVVWVLLRTVAKALP